MWVKSVAAVAVLALIAASMPGESNALSFCCVHRMHATQKGTRKAAADRRPPAHCNEKKCLHDNGCTSRLYEMNFADVQRPCARARHTRGRST